MDMPRCERCGVLVLNDKALYFLHAQRRSARVCERCWLVKRKHRIESALVPPENSTLRQPAAPRRIA